MNGTGRDLSRLCDWLSTNAGLGENCRVTGQGQPKTGFSADTLILSVESDRGPAEIVVRIEHPGRSIFLDTSIKRQADMMGALAVHQVPVPHVLGWDDDEAVVGAPFLVMLKRKGVALPQHPSYHVAGLLVDLDPASRARAWREALEVIAQINRIDWRGDFDFLLSPPRGSPGLDHYLGWIEAWRAQCCAAEHPVIDAAMTYLRENRPATRSADLLWGDSNPGNFLFDENGSVVAALDFEAASIGPAEIDLGWWFVLDRMLSAGNPLPPGMPDRAGQIALYEHALGRPVADLFYYEVLAALRMSLVIARTAGLLIAAGTLPADNKVALFNPAATMLAAMIGIDHDSRMDHYMAMVQAMNSRYPRRKARDYPARTDARNHP